MTRTTTGFELEIPLAYIESTIPAGQTISDYRRHRAHRPSLWSGLATSPATPASRPARPA